MKARIYVPASNTPGINAKTGRPWNDALGAFQPEMTRFAHTHDLGSDSIVMFDNLLPFPKRVNVVLDDLEKQSALDAVIFSCHGFKTGIQAGFDLRNIDKLVSAIAKASHPGVIVMLYCCDTGRDNDPDRKDDMQEGPGGDGGFADQLRDRLCKLGHTQCVVFGHPNAGHTTMFPFVRVFAGNGKPEGGIGGEWLFDPKSDPLFRKWADKMDEGTLRYRFPFMTKKEIEAELTQGVGKPTKQT